MYYFVVGAMPFLLPLMFEVQFGWSPVKSGAVTAFVFAGNVGIKPATTPLINRFGFRSAADRLDGGHRRHRRGARVHHRLDPGRGNRRAGPGQRYYQVDRVHRLHHGRARGHGARAHARREHPAATSLQLGAGLAVAGATVALRVGDAVTGGGQAAFTVAFCLLALVAVGCAGGALRLDPAAGNAARRPRAAVPPASSAPYGRVG